MNWTLGRNVLKVLCRDWSIVPLAPSQQMFIKRILIAVFLSLLIPAVNAANQLPTIGAIANRVVLEDNPTEAIQLSLSDAETPLVSLQLSGTSSNPALVPNTNIFFGMAGGLWYTTVTPTLGQTGTATITVAVSDGQASASTSFLVTVNPIPSGWSRFVNLSPITIPTLGAATPYPSEISVSGTVGVVTNVIVTLSKFNHQKTLDVNMLLVAPTGQKALIFSHISGDSR